MKRRKFINYFSNLIIPHIIYNKYYNNVHEYISAPNNIILFSKHLQFLNVHELANVLSNLGFSGVELTIRKNGHINPLNVDEELPNAIKILKKKGLKCPSIVTEITDSNDKIGQKILKVASSLGINLYRMGYYHDYPGINIEDSMKFHQEKLYNLSLLNKEYGIIGCYQNHAGAYVGASIWELYEMVKYCSPKNIGIQYDIRHAVVEGGLSWKRNLELIIPWVKSIAVKDFRWTKTNGHWKVQNTPIGDGMVNWREYFRFLKSVSLSIPISLHLEYPLGGAEFGSKELDIEPRILYDAIKRDLQVIRNFWSEA